MYSRSGLSSECLVFWIKYMNTEAVQILEVMYACCFDGWNPKAHYNKDTVSRHLGRSDGGKWHLCGHITLWMLAWNTLTTLLWAAQIGIPIVKLQRAHWELAKVLSATSYAKYSQHTSTGMRPHLSKLYTQGHSSKHHHGGILGDRHIPK